MIKVTKVLGLLVLGLALVAGSGACGDADDEAGVEETSSQGQERFGDSFPGRLVGDLPERVEELDVTDAEFSQLVAGNSEFAFDLYRLAAEKSPGQNTFMSPHSTSVAFAMSLPVANDAEPIRRNLKFGLADDRLHPAMAQLVREFERHADVTPPEGAEPFILTMPNGIWVEESREAQYATEDLLGLYGGYYDAPMASLPFRTDPSGSEARLNAWVSAQTDGRIPQLMRGNVTPDTTSVQINAIYFKASWSRPFEEAATFDAAFQAPGGEVQASTMHISEGFRYAKTEALDAVSLPYVSAGMEMLVIAPAAGTFDAYEAQLSPEAIDAVLAQMQWGPLQLALPKFEVDTRVDLTALLEDPFSTAIHQANISVDESGTVASAATAVIIGGNNGGVEEFIPMAIDRPFILLIRDTETGAILFLGRVLDPTA